MSDDHGFQTIDKIAHLVLIDATHNKAVQDAARIAETLIKTRNVDTKTGHVTNIRRGASGQEIADEIRRQLLRKA